MDYKVNIVQEIYHKFEEWLDSLLDNNDMPEDTAAYNFNLYDEAMEGIVYGIQIVACDKFDPDDKGGDWACHMVWYSEEDIFCLDFSDEEDSSFEYVQAVFTAFVKKYLDEGKHRELLLASRGIGIGRVEGDLDIIYVNNKEL